MILYDEEGQGWEFLCYDDPERVDANKGYKCLAAGTGRLIPIEDVFSGQSCNCRAIFRRVPKRHTFGGVVFEETGENRSPDKGEWYIHGNGCNCWGGTGTTHGKFTILRPVAIEGQES